MSVYHDACEVCGSHETEKVHEVVERDAVIHIRICDECGSEYEVHFGLSHKEVTHNGQEDDDR